MGRTKKRVISKRKRDDSSSSSTSTSSSSSSSGGESVRAKLKRLKKLEKYVSNVKSVNTSLSDENVIPPFDPQNSETSVEQWVSRVDGLAKCYGWNSLTVVKLVANRLKGMARRWYDTQDNLYPKWAIMKKELVEQFKKPLPFGRLLREAANFEVQSGQDLSEYCFNKLNKLKALKIDIPQIYLVDAVISGIKDENIVRAARSSNISNTSELYSYLSTLDYKYSLQKSENKKTDQCNRTWNTKGQDPVSSNSGNNRSKSSVSCFNCSGPHYAKVCPKPKIECFKCKKLGHKQHLCPLNSKTHLKREKPSINMVGQLEVSNPYVMTVTINGVKFKCLLDTGSSCTILRQHVVDLLGLKVDSNKNDPILRSFSGNLLASSGTVYVKIRIGEATAILRAVVLCDDQMVHECIVGCDFLNLPHILFYKVGVNVVIRELPEQNPEKMANFEIVSKVDFNNFGENVPSECGTECRDLLHEYRDCIATSMATLGKTNTTKMVIRTITDEPVVYNPYRMSLSEKIILQNLIDELLENNIIRESTSPYASPILLIKKKTGDYRMCVDYRRLNAITIKDKYPLPLIDDQIDRLGDNKYFTALDMASGFYQVPVDEDSIAKTAFVTPDSHYEFLRMPFGLSNSPAVFQRLINNVLGKLKNTVAFPYIDDIIIPSKTLAEGLTNLRLVLDALRKHNLTLKLKKCTFFQTKINYLGREISAEGVRPGQVKIDAIMRMDPPQTVKQVRQFLGLAGYFRKFCNNFARVTEPISKLTRKSVPWQWTSEQQSSFDAVKSMLTSRPILSIFDPTLPTELHTDASSDGFGAILFQVRSGKLHVIAYYSKQTTVDQKSYHSYELETMAVVFALRHFRSYLLGIKFTVVTDCNSLRTTFSKKDLVPRVARWWLEVQDYTFEIKYRPGERMRHVDALSRYPAMKEMIDINEIDITEGDWILTAQLQDEQLLRIRNILQGNMRTTENKMYFDEYELKHNKIYRKMPDGRRLWVVPRAARWQICILCHDKNGHTGVEQTIKRIKMNYWFAKMRRFVTKYISACLNCAYYKDTTHKNRGKLHPIEKPAVPFHTIHIDHVGPFETSSRKNKFIFVIVDGFTKFTIIEPVKSTKSKLVVNILENVFHLFGVPTRIISDRGTAFTSREFRLFCEAYSVKHVMNAVATPRGNGQCERYNKTILNMLATSTVEDDSILWDTHVKRVQSALNTSFNKGIGTTPALALFGHQPTTTAEATLLNSIREEVDRIDIGHLRSKIKQHISEDQRKQKERYNQKRKEVKQYKQGELVLVLITSEKNTGASRKLFPKYKGPFRITKVLFNDRYEVEDLREARQKIKTVISAEKLKPWVAVVEEHD